MSCDSLRSLDWLRGGSLAHNVGGTLDCPCRAGSSRRPPPIRPPRPSHTGGPGGRFVSHALMTRRACGR
eukprot:527380-Prymnesium_polylepis.2